MDDMIAGLVARLRRNAEDYRFYAEQNGKLYGASDRARAAAYDDAADTVIGHYKDYLIREGEEDRIDAAIKEDAPWHRDLSGTAWPKVTP